MTGGSAQGRCDGPPPWFEAVRWDAPWLSFLRPWAQASQRALREGQSVHRVLNDLALSLHEGEAPGVRFVPQTALPADQAYEDFIWRERLVPTRDNAHDFFNGLTWLAFPRTKARLNELQAAQIEASGVGATRGPVRDALTVFDENAAIVLAPPPLMQALRARHWQRLFIELRPLWAQTQVWLFGHAAQEKLLQPRKAITAHVYWPEAPLSADALDASLADSLHPGHLAEKPYSPLPLLGIPQWWPENEHPGFYDDAGVFRAPPAGP